MINIKISASSVFKVLVAVILLLVIAHFASQYYIQQSGYPAGSVRYSLVQKFNLDGEMTVGSWYSQAGLLLCSVLLAAIGLIRSKMNSKYTYHWYALAAIFVYLSFDEVSAIHEMAVGTVRRVLGINEGLLYFAWVVPVVMLLLFVTLFFIRFWLKLPRKTRYLFLLSATLFLAGSVGVEMISARQYAMNPHQALNTNFWIVSSAIEESLELLGVAVFIYSLIGYISSLLHKNDIKLKFTN